VFDWVLPLGDLLVAIAISSAESRGGTMGDDIGSLVCVGQVASFVAGEVDALDARRGKPSLSAAAVDCG
jgi:hypothetical protein